MYALKQDGKRGWRRGRVGLGPGRRMGGGRKKRLPKVGSRKRNEIKKKKNGGVVEKRTEGGQRQGIVRGALVKVKEGEKSKRAECQFSGKANVSDFLQKEAGKSWSKAEKRFAKHRKTQKKKKNTSRKGENVWTEGWLREICRGKAVERDKKGGSLKRGSGGSFWKTESIQNLSLEGVRKVSKGRSGKVRKSTGKNTGH